MKECPVCHCITEEEYECHVCGTTITYEPSVYPAERERLVWNKYTRRYLLRKLYFPLLSIAVVIVLILVSLPLEPIRVTETAMIGEHRAELKVHNSNEQYLWGSLFLALLSVVFALCERKLAQWLEWKYNSEYAAVRAASEKFLFGGGAILSALAIVLSELA